MDYKKRIQSKEGYVAHFTKTPFTLQEKTRKLCQSHDQDPDNKEILQTLFGTCCNCGALRVCAISFSASSSSRNAI